jgi:hypothetical protein
MYPGYFSDTLDTTGAPYDLMRSSIFVMEPCERRSATRGRGEDEKLRRVSPENEHSWRDLARERRRARRVARGIARDRAGEFKKRS